MVGHILCDFGGETAVITGSTKRIGRGIAAGLADTDVNIVVNSRSKSAVESVAAELTERAAGWALGVAADVESIDEIDPLVDRTAEEILEACGGKRPLGRLGQPEDIADAVLWLASDRADYVVGDIVRVSGGSNLE